MWNQHSPGVLLIVVNSLSTDSFLYLVGEEAGPTEWPAASFPEYTDDRLQGFVDHLWAASDGNLTAGVSVLSGPGLYTLTVALARADGTGRQPSSREQRIAAQTASIAPALLTELRRRDCRGMGDDPTGPVRRGQTPTTDWSLHNPNRVGGNDAAAPEAGGGLSILRRRRIIAGIAASGHVAVFRL